MKDVASFVKGSWFDSIDLSRIGLHCGFRTELEARSKIRKIQSGIFGFCKVRISENTK